MRTLTKPIDNPKDVFLICISRIRDVSLKARLISVEAIIISAASSFESAASTTTLHNLSPQSDINGVVTTQEMTNVYTNRMAKKGSPGREIYDRLLSAPAYGRCPLCGQRVVSTLDHHLPKSSYPTLTVVPINLVPSCADCNRAKIDAVPQTAAQETLHPYFDDADGDSWLYAKVIETSPATLHFFVEPPTIWNELKAERVRHHFKVFKLSYLYTSHAATELVNIRDRLTQLFSQTGYQEVSDHLRKEAESRESAYLNSWQTAMYKALAASHWYCSGGFNL